MLMLDRLSDASSPPPQQLGIGVPLPVRNHCSAHLLFPPPPPLLHWRLFRPHSATVITSSNWILFNSDDAVCWRWNARFRRVHRFGFTQFLSIALRHQHRHCCPVPSFFCSKPNSLFVNSIISAWLSLQSTCTADGVVCHLPPFLLDYPRRRCHISSTARHIFSRTVSNPFVSTNCFQRNKFSLLVAFAEASQERSVLTPTAPRDPRHVKSQKCLTLSQSKVISINKQ